MIGGATVISLIYKAAQHYPENRFVQHALKLHISCVIDQKSGVPDDMIVWIKNQSNQFLGGGKYNLIEYLNDLTESDKKWDTHRQSQTPKIEYSTCPPRLAIHIIEGTPKTQEQQRV